MRKHFKAIERENGTIYLYGNHHWKEIIYEVPEWTKEEQNPDVEACFYYLGERYFISEFMPVKKGSPFYNLGDIGFTGYKSDSFFSGVLMTFHEYGDAVQAYTYIS